MSVLHLLVATSIGQQCRSELCLGAQEAFPGCCRSGRWLCCVHSSAPALTQTQLPCPDSAIPLLMQAQTTATSFPVWDMYHGDGVKDVGAASGACLADCCQVLPAKDAKDAYSTSSRAHCLKLMLSSCTLQGNGCRQLTAEAGSTLPALWTQRLHSMSSGGSSSSSVPAWTRTPWTPPAARTSPCL